MTLDKIAVLIGILSGLVGIAGVLQQFKWKKCAAATLFLSLAAFAILVSYSAMSDVLPQPTEEGHTGSSHVWKEQEHHHPSCPVQEPAPQSPERERWQEKANPGARRTPPGRHPREER